MIFFTIINLILVAFSIVGFVLTIFSPVGLILLIVYFVKRKENESKKLLKWSLILLSGIPILIITFTLYSVLSLISTMFNLNPLVNPGGGLMMLNQ